MDPTNPNQGGTPTEPATPVADTPPPSNPVDQGGGAWTPPASGPMPTPPAPEPGAPVDQPGAPTVPPSPEPTPQEGPGVEQPGDEAPTA